jgi:phosphoribosyl 1,2-cyclic phosphodiesterase
VNISFLGAHNVESCDTGYTCLVIDGIIAIDTGGLTAGLSFAMQRSLKAILLTHQHYDHIRDLPGIAMNLYASGDSISVYGTADVYGALAKHLFDGEIYPNFLKRPPENPTLRFVEFLPYQSMKIEGYVVLPVPVEHAVPTVGYQITSPEGKSVFYTSDTGPGLEECWELLAFQKEQGYLPQIVTVHMNPELEEEIEAELGDVAVALNHPITPGYEGMQLRL